MSYHEYFPEGFIQLQLEMGHHPLLIQRIQKHHSLGMEVVLAECCHYCGIMIDATLDGEQLVALADTLVTKLKGMKVREAIKTQSENWGKEAWKFGLH